MAVYDQRVLSMYSGLGPLLGYFQRIPNAQVPFPGLVELNIDGVWDAPGPSRRFESNQAALLVSRSRLLCSGVRRLSALESAGVGGVPLYESLHHCLPTLRRLHLSRALSLDTQMLVTLVGSRQTLPLMSLDLSGCVSVDAHGLAALIACCRGLVHVNLSQTAADNTVLAALTRVAGMDDAAGLEVLVLDTTNITGAAVRDFASACAKRFCRERGNAHAPRAWRLRLLDVDNCAGIGADAVAVTRDLLSFMRTRVLAAMAGGSAAAGIPRPATSGDGEPESEYEEEEFYMIATLPAGAVSRARSAAAGREGEGDGRPLYALIDMDSERPLLELDGNIYQGVKDELLGTAMVFDLAEGGSDDEGGGGDDVDDDGESGEMDARLVGMTSQVVAFHPVRLSKK
ncbi:hypothetical protein LPJ61_003655 [Coemansia biformis]|uniref:Transcription factor TFIIIC triple barrel domain-containing protein n=1 Tax=Coemansia biformis TaxID=1286918 RepID=A0A9W7YA46_9FUNG|nr:hypothetical protein LPJ61_003655 [Coemansia biformis]